MFDGSLIRILPMDGQKSHDFTNRNISQFVISSETMATLKRRDVDLYCEVAGQGVPLLLIQGVGVVGEGWRPQVDALKHRFQTLIFDNRGIGKSTPCNGPISIEAMAEDARALMDGAGWESAHVIGH